MVSNRTGGMGDDDIYKFIKRSEAVCGTVADSKTNAQLENANITATSADGERVGIRTNMKGDFCLNLAPGKTYKLEAEKEGYGKFEGKIVARPFKNEKKTILKSDTLYCSNWLCLPFDCWPSHLKKSTRFF